MDGAIHRAAGPELLAECRTLGGCETGQAKITKAYKLPCDYVIHTVSPVWHGGKLGEAKLLASCYRNALKLAMEHNIRSVAFPSISTGVYAYPIGQAAKVAVRTVDGFVREHLGAFIDILWVLFDKYDKIGLRRGSFLISKGAYRTRRRSRKIYAVLILHSASSNFPPV